MANFNNVNIVIVLLAGLLLEATVVVGSSPNVQLLVFETDVGIAASGSTELLTKHASELLGIKATTFGSGSQFNGFSSKYKAVEPLLKALDPDTLVILSDGRDVLVNVLGTSTVASSAKALTRVFNELVADSPNSIVVSAEAQCCVAALTYFTPGSLFTASGDRQGQACASGTSGCMWAGDEHTTPWTGFMHSLAALKTGKPQTDFALNAGLMAGKPADLLNLIKSLQMEEHEDDQAVMTDFLYTFPTRLTLDYDQRLFGNNRWPLGMSGGGCVFEFDSQQERLVHTEKATAPFFLHSPGQFFDCNDKMAEELKQKHVTHSKRRLLGGNNYNYGNSSVTTGAPGTNQVTTYKIETKSAISIDYDVMMAITGLKAKILTGFILGLAEGLGGTTAEQITFTDNTVAALVPRPNARRLDANARGPQLVMPFTGGTVLTAVTTVADANAQTTLQEKVVAKAADISMQMLLKIKAVDGVDAACGGSCGSLVASEPVVTSLSVVTAVTTPEPGFDLSADRASQMCTSLGLILALMGGAAPLLQIRL